MCDLLPFGLTEKQRETFTNMYKKLVLVRFYKTVLKKKETFKIINSEYEKEFKDMLKFDKESLDTIEKDWTFPRCCSEFNILEKKNKSLPFNDLLEEITNTEGGFLSLVPSTDIGAARIKQTLIEESGNLPIIEALRLSISNHEIHPQSARALTRLFYLSDQTEKQYVEDIKLAAKSKAFRERLLPQLLLTLLIKQNICPHFNILAAMFSCLQNCDNKDTKSVEAKMFLISEWPTITVLEWIKEPDSTSKEFKLWKLNRPLLAEIQNLVFQFLFTMYILSMCSIKMPKGPYPEDLLRLQKCKRVDGIFIYKTEKYTFYVPNLGDTLILCSNTVPQPLTIAKGKKLKANKRLFEFILLKLGEWKVEIDKWNQVDEAKATFLEKLDESSSTFNFPLKVDTIHENQAKSLPVPLKINEKTKIQGWLVKLITDWSGATLANDPIKLEAFLFEHFSIYRSIFVDETHAPEDLTIETYFGLSENSRKRLKLPLMFMSREVPFYNEARYDGPWKKYIQVENDTKNLIVDADVETMVNNLTNLTSSGRYKSIMDFITQGVHSFLTKLDNDLRYSISDRHDIEASHLDARKKMRSYASTFLRLLMQAENDPFPVFTISTLKKWATLAQLRDAFSNNLNLYLQADPKVKDLLKSTLQVEDPRDVRNILTALMFLSFASGPTTGKSALSSVIPGTGPSPVVEATTKEDEAKMLKLFAELIGENESDIAEMLKYIEGKFGLPNDVRYLLHELIEKITYNMEQDEWTHLDEHSFGYQVEGEYERPIEKIKNPQELDLPSLEKEIQKQTEQLLSLKKKYSILQNNDANDNINVN